jgi:hypothetical protein
MCPAARTVDGTVHAAGHNRTRTGEAAGVSGATGDGAGLGTGWAGPDTLTGIRNGAQRAAVPSV